MYRAVPMRSDTRFSPHGVPRLLHKLAGRYPHRPPIKQLPYILAPMEKLCYDGTIDIFISGKGERHG